MLRIGPDFDCHNINESQEYLIFTKTHDVRVVNIYVIEQMDKMVYIFTEIPDSRL
jgi:hypothetical protein